MTPLFPMGSCLNHRVAKLGGWEEKLFLPSPGKPNAIIETFISERRKQEIEKEKM